jgi:hypothetical protein
LRRYLVLGEETELARCPDWYPFIKAAQYLNCKPWELMEAPGATYWKEKALKARTAEIQAQDFRDKRA